MHLSTQLSSPFYHPAYLYATVTLDGVVVSGLVDADEELGRVRVYGPYDEQLQRAVNTRRGLVRIKFRADELQAKGLMNYPSGPKIEERNLVRVKDAVQGLGRFR